MRLSTLLSAIVRRLDLILPLVVLIAALFAAPGRLSPENLLRRWQHNADIARLGEIIGKLPDPDAELAKSLGKASSVVPFILLNGPGRGTPELKAGFAMAGDDALPFAP